MAANELGPLGVQLGGPERGAGAREHESVDAVGRVRAEPLPHEPAEREPAEGGARDPERVEQRDLRERDPLDRHRACRDG